MEICADGVLGRPAVVEGTDGVVVAVAAAVGIVTTDCTMGPPLLAVSMPAAYTLYDAPAVTAAEKVTGRSMEMPARAAGTTCWPARIAAVLVVPAAVVVASAAVLVKLATRVCSTAAEVGAAACSGIIAKYPMPASFMLIDKVPPVLLSAATEKVNVGAAVSVFVDDVGVVKMGSSTGVVEYPALAVEVATTQVT